MLEEIKELKIEERCKKMLTYLQMELNIVNKNSTGPCWWVGKTLVFFKQVTHEKLKYRQLIIRGKW